MIKNNYKYLTIEIDNGIGILTLNREDKLNALNSEVFDELRDFLVSTCQKDSEHNIKGLIFTGAGEKAFIAGADISEMDGMSNKAAEEFAHKGQEVSLLFEEMRYPVIAAVNGFALGGGCEMALACDFIICTENSIFGLPEVGLGLIPGFGGTQRLAKVIGRNRAKEIIYTGRKIKADEAKQIGLVLDILPTKEDLIAKAKDILGKTMRNSPNAIGVVKYVVNKGIDLTLEEGLKVERESFGEIFGSADMIEGTKAFMEKRKPIFN